MEVFNQAYEGLTGANSFKVKDKYLGKYSRNKHPRLKFELKTIEETIDTVRFNQYFNFEYQNGKLFKNLEFMRYFFIRSAKNIIDCGRNLL